MMVQSLTEPHADAERRDGRLDRVAGTFHLTQSSRRMGLTRHGLDWSGFRDLYYPASRRHDLEAIVAYGAYQRTSLAGPLPASEAACGGGATQPKRCLSRTGRTKAAGRANATSAVVESCATQHGACLSPLWWMSALVVFEGVEALHVPLRLSHRPERSREFIRTLLS